MRDGVVKIAVVITDGKSHDVEATRDEARLLREAGAHVFAIGVGSQFVKEELRLIASRPSDEFVFTVENYRALAQIRHMLALKTCQGKPVLTLRFTVAPDFHSFISLLFK